MSSEIEGQLTKQFHEKGFLGTLTLSNPQQSTNFKDTGASLPRWKKYTTGPNVVTDIVIFFLGPF